MLWLLDWAFMYLSLKRTFVTVEERHLQDSQLNRTFYSGDLARDKRSNMGNKIWLAVHPRNFCSDKFVRTYVHPFRLTDVKMSHLPACSRRPIQFVLNLILWSIDSCQKRESADQCQMTVSRVQVHNSLSWFVLKVLRCCFSVYRRLRSIFFRRNSVCFSLTAKAQLL